MGCDRVARLVDIVDSIALQLDERFTVGVEKGLALLGADGVISHLPEANGTDPPRGTTVASDPQGEST